MFKHVVFWTGSILCVVSGIANGQQELNQQLDNVQSEATAMRGLPRANEILIDLDALDATIAAVRAAIAALPPVDPPDPPIDPPDNPNPGELTITDTHVFLPSGESFPRAAVAPAFCTQQSGEWHDPATWAGNQVPAPGTSVRICENHAVDFVGIDGNEYGDIEVFGSFRLADFCELHWDTLIVFPQGQVITDPSAAAINIVVNDTPIDLSIDPWQMKQGFIVFGTMRLNGEPRKTWSRLTTGLSAGESSFDTQEATDWKAGDEVVINGTRMFVPKKLRDQLDLSKTTEYLTLADAGAFTSPLVYDHLSMPDNAGNHTGTPAIGLLSRGITLRSENPSGTRGHGMIAGRGSVDLQYVRFSGMGRTRGDVQGDLTDEPHETIRNQAGRYPIHFHHCPGPQRPQPANPDDYHTGFQSQIVGCAVDDGLVWGITLHGSSYVLVQDNVVVDCQGAGIFAEAGDEMYCDVVGNFVADIRGGWEVAGVHAGAQKNTPDFGRDGSGIWFRNACHTDLVGNYVGDIQGWAFNFNGYYDAKDGYHPRWRGDYNSVEFDGSPVGYGTILNNEAAGCLGGWWATWDQNNAGGVKDFVSFDLVDMKFWNCLSPVETFHTGQHKFHDSICVGDPAITRQSPGSKAWDGGKTTAVQQSHTYENGGHEYFNLFVDGYGIGVVAPQNMTGSEVPGQYGHQRFHIHSGYIRAAIPIVSKADDHPVRSVELEQRGVINATLVSDPTLAPLARPEQHCEVWIAPDHDNITTNDGTVVSNWTYDINGVLYDYRGDN